MSRTLVVGLVAVACSTAAARDAAVAVIGGTPRLVVDGQPFSATAVMPSIRCRPGGDVGVLRQFADCGIRLSSDVWTVREREGGTNTWWIDEGVYDWAFFDALAHGLTDASATGLIIPRIKIDPPSRWLARHPEEMFSGLVDVRSRAWRRLYRRMLRDLVAHVEASDYSDRLIGYHLGALHCGEWIVYPLDKNITLDHVFFSNAEETMWTCEDITIKNTEINGNYFGKEALRHSVCRRKLKP